MAGPCTLNVRLRGPLPIDSAARLAEMPAEPGVYIIYDGETPWYVGVSTTSMRNRFLDRRKALVELNIPPEILSRRSVHFATLIKPLPTCPISIKTRKASSTERPATGPNAALKVLEQFFIHHYKTNTGNRGNQRGDPIKVAGTGPLTISIMKKGDTSPTVYPFAPKFSSGNQPATVIDTRRQAMTR